jgi:hypothetical protein
LEYIRVPQAGHLIFRRALLSDAAPHLGQAGFSKGVFSISVISF